MGADLYRDDFTHIHSDPQLDAQFTRLVDARNHACSRSDGRNYAPGANDVCDAAQADLDRFYDGIYGHPKYFRDSYNDSSLFWKLGMSWWGDLEPFLGPNADGELEEVTQTYTIDGKEYTETGTDYSLYPAGCLKIKEEVEMRRTFLDVALMKMSEEVKDGIYTPTGEQWAEVESYFYGKYEKLLDFLQQAADGGHRIRCSV